jgi:hypothetical protein
MVTNMPTIRAKLIASPSESHELSGSPDLLIILYMHSLYSICDLLSSDLVQRILANQKLSGFVFSMHT